MEVGLLVDAIERWEADGTLQVGEAVVHGHHEPVPVEGAWGLAIPPGGPAEVARWCDGAWDVQRRDPDPAAATGYVFDRLGELVAERHWGPQEWASIERRVALGAQLRTAALLLWPEADLRPDRWALAARLRELGVEPEGRWWVADVDDLPAPDELVVQLRRTDEGFAVGVEERGAWNEWVRTSDEATACRAVFRSVVSGSVVTMGMAGQEPHVLAPFVPLVRDALAQALADLDAAVASGADVVDGADGGGPDAPEGGP